MTDQGSDVILDRLFQLHPKIIDLTLDRMWRLLGKLDHPERSIPPVIHIAGTNGKGSTLAMVRAGLEAAGHITHAYTSPHLVRFHERIRLAGELIDEDVLAALLQECEDANGGTPITFFEITTIAALLAFSRTPADYTLLEVGLGGRLDATNIVSQPELTIITPVSLDHQQYLGETISQIATEKAGILKRGVSCIVAPQTDEGLEAIQEQAYRVGAPLLVHGQDWLVRVEHGRLVYQDEQCLLDLDLPRLPGQHQVINAGTAIAALRSLGKEQAACQAALTRAQWPARMQRLTRGPLVEVAAGADLWVDGGHNPAAGEAMAAILDDWRAHAAVPVYLVTGMLNSKAVADYLAPLAPRIKGLQAVTIPGQPSAYTAVEMADIARRVGIEASAADSVEAAISTISTRPGPKRIIVCGSLYLAGTILGDNS